MASETISHTTPSKRPARMYFASQVGGFSGLILVLVRRLRWGRRGPVGACHAGRLIRTAGRERRRKGQRKDNAQQGYVSCRVCTSRFLSLPVLTGTIYPQIRTDNIAELLWVSMLRHPFRHSHICVGMSASAGMSGRARTGLVFAGSQPR